MRGSSNRRSLINNGAEIGRRERQKLKRREQILACAVEAFERLGFEGVSVEAIAEAADVSLRTLYNFYPTKLDLLVAGYVRTLRQELENALMKLADPPAAPRNGVYQWAQAHFQVYATMDRDLLLRATLHALAQGPRRGGGHDYADLDLFALSGLRQILDIYVTRGRLPPRIDVDALARVIFAAGNGEFFLWLGDPDATVESALRHMRSHIDLALSSALRDHHSSASAARLS